MNNDGHRSAGIKAGKDLFKEFPDAPQPDNDGQDRGSGPENAVAASPFLQAVENLATLFDREVNALREEDYDSFKRLQRDKLAAIRNVERLQHSANSDTLGDNRADTEIRLGRLNEAIERNMKCLNAVRQATQAVQRYALKAVEEKQSDGVYAKNGSLKGLACLSVNGNNIKL